MKKTIFSISAAALIAGAAHAGNINLTDCLIQEIIPGGHSTAAFFNLNNTGKETVELTAAAVPALTNHAELHKMTMDKKTGTMTMQQISFFAVTPGKHQFKLGGYHVMLMNMDAAAKNAPKIGESYPLTLTFSNGKTLTCDAKVLSVQEIRKIFPTDAKMGKMTMPGHQMDKAHSEHHHQ